MAALGADLSGQRRTIRVFQCPIAKPYSRRPAKQPWLAEGAADPGGETRVLRFIPSVEWNQWAISTVLAVEYDDGGVADENHTWMCGARARFLNREIPAQAKGCIKGAFIGGTAGHFAGHHGLLGAAAGCVVGRHEANRQRQLKLQQQNAQPSTAH
jgi:hypothetical protein